LYNLNQKEQVPLNKHQSQIAIIIHQNRPSRQRSICLEAQKPAVSEGWISFQPSRSAAIIGRTSNIILLVTATTWEPATCFGERTSPKWIPIPSSHEKSSAGQHHQQTNLHCWQQSSNREPAAQAYGERASPILFGFRVDI